MAVCTGWATPPWEPAVAEVERTAHKYADARKKHKLRLVSVFFCCREFPTMVALCQAILGSCLGGHKHDCANISFHLANCTSAMARARHLWRIRKWCLGTALRAFASRNDKFTSAGLE